MTITSLNLSQQEVSLIENALLSYRDQLPQSDQNKCNVILEKFKHTHKDALQQKNSQSVDSDYFGESLCIPYVQAQLLRMFNYLSGQNPIFHARLPEISNATSRKCLFLSSSLLSDHVFEGVIFDGMSYNDSEFIKHEIERYLNSVHDFSELELSAQELQYYRVAFFMRLYNQSLFESIRDNEKHSPVYAVSVERSLNTKSEWLELLSKPVDDNNESHYIYLNFDIFSMSRTDQDAAESVKRIPLGLFSGNIGHSRTNMIRIY